MKTQRKLRSIAGGRIDAPVTFIGIDRYKLMEFDGVFLQTLTDEAVKRNWQLVELELFDGHPPTGIKFDGIFARSLPGSERIKELKRFTPNLIRIGSAPHPGDDLLPAVLPDLEAQGELAARHFAERGFFNIGFVGRRPWSIWWHLYSGVQKGVKERGMSVELLRLPAFADTHDPGSSTSAYALFTKWIREVPKPLGLVCPSDHFAGKFCAWVRSAGLRVPTDVAILSNGNHHAICERCLPRLSSIQVAEDLKCVAACELMEKLLAGKKPPGKPIMIPPTGITVRESTDVLAAVNPVVADALIYMWANIAKNLSVDDIADHVGLHRRKLERGFRAELGRGVNAELMRRRLEESAELLEETDLTVADIAVITGFRSDDYLYRSFKRTFGATPIQWRKANSEK